MANSHYSIWHKSSHQTLAAAKGELCNAENLELHSEGPGTGRTWGPRGSGVYLHAPRCRSLAALPRRSKPSLLSRAVASVASVFGGARKMERCSRAEATREMSDASSDASDDVTLEEEWLSRAAPGCAAHHGAMPRLACSRDVAVPAPAAATRKSVLAEDLISVEQVSRMSKRAANRKTAF